VALSGTSASAAWTVPTLTLTPGAVALTATQPASTWNTAGSLSGSGTVALVGSSASANWAVPDVALSVTAATPDVIVHVGSDIGIVDVGETITTVNISAITTVIC
jgi:hypothetical protein